jgi:hypothetical protein
MPTTVINDFSIEPKAEPPAAGRPAADAKSDGGGKGSPDAAREIERVLRHNRHRAMRLWVY